MTDATQPGVLEQLTITRDGIWDHLERASETDEWADREADDEAAELAGRAKILAWRRRIEQFLATTVRC